MNIQHIMVVIDPTSENEQPCMRRAEQLAGHYPQARFTLFVCDYIPELEGGLLFSNDLLAEARNKLLGHREEYLDRLAAPLRARGHIVNTTAVWGERLERHHMRSEHVQQPDALRRTGHRHSLCKRLLLSTSNWLLSRNCPVPLRQVMQPDAPVQHLCASVDRLHESDKPAALVHYMLNT